ncbi:SCO4848 family membrane protein [Streptomyces sp. NPDC008139]|uniref:SCO4848 family membrane protein n=1 Tax=Streptomyces sp. NPDC008139 TaxID=3364814 RepID=UPI0036E29A96
MKLSRRVSWFLVAFGVWSWIVWVTFVKNLWKDTSGLAFHDGDHGSPTAYFWIHLTLAIVSFLLGTAIAALGARSLRALRREAAEAGPADPAQEPAPTSPAAPADQESADSRV